MTGGEMLPVDVIPALARLASPLARLFTQAAKPHARTCQTHPHPAFCCNIRARIFRYKVAAIMWLLLSVSTVSSAEDKLDLDTTVIKGNKELPKILYVVPWKDTEKHRQKDRKLVLHSLFGQLFEPVLPPQNKP